MWEDGELRCYGAGLLSSFGEIDEFRGADIRPVDFHEMATLEYDITHYQPILFACDGMGELTDRVGGFFAEFDDDTPARLAHGRLHARGRRVGPAGVYACRGPASAAGRRREVGPDGGVRDVLAVLRADARVAVDGAEPDADRLPPVGPAAVEVAAAARAERLDEAAAGRRPLGHELLALRDAEAAGRDRPGRRRRRPGPALAAGAVAPAGATSGSVISKAT